MLDLHFSLHNKHILTLPAHVWDLKVLKNSQIRQFNMWLLLLGTFQKALFTVLKVSAAAAWPQDRMWRHLRYAVDGSFFRVGIKLRSSFWAMQLGVSDISRLFLERYDKTTCLGSHN